MKKANFMALCLVGIILGLWQGGVVLFKIPSFILPSPSAIITTSFTQADLLFSHSLITFAEIILGILLALVTAIPLSIAMFAKPELGKAISPFLVASQAVPVFAIAPLLVVWLGYGIASKVFMAWIIIFFPITISLVSGFKSCDREFQVLFELMGASFFDTFKLLYWPWALPYFFSGLRVGVSVATIGAVIGEWVGAQKGLGFLMIQSNARLRVDLVFAAIIWLSVMGLLMWYLVGFLEKKTITWKT